MRCGGDAERVAQGQRRRSIANQTITDDGALNVGTGATMTFEIGYETTTQIVVNGTMEATGATFNRGGNDYSNTLIQVNSGGELTATGSTFALNQLVLEGGSLLTARPT